MQHAIARVDAFGRLEHLIRRRRREDLPGTRRIKHAQPHVPAMQRFVARTAAGHQTDLARLRRVASIDDAIDVIDAHLGTGSLDAEQRLRDHILRVVDELLHGCDPTAL